MFENVPCISYQTNKKKKSNTAMAVDFFLLFESTTLHKNSVTKEQNYFLVFY